MNPNRLKKLFRKWTVPVVLLALLGAAVSFVVSKNLTPIYEASGSVLVIAGPNQTAGVSTGLNINATQATTTAAVLLTEPPLLRQVNQTLGLGLTTDQLAAEVTATPQSNTELVSVLVRDPSATRAAQIANGLMTTYVGQVSSQNGQRIAQAGAALQAQISQVEQTITQEEQQLAVAQKTSQDSTALRATLSSNNALLTQLTLNYSSFKASQAQNLESVSVAAPASVPALPGSPKASLNTVLGGIAGLALGLALAAILEFLDQGLHTADDVMARLGVPCLGVVPTYRTTRRGGKSRKRRLTDGDKRAAVAASEAYRRLRTNLLFATPDAELRSVVFTSVRSGEGKTCTAANIAVALASSEKRVLLIDADMRRPDQHRLFGKTLDHGLSELIVSSPTGSTPSLSSAKATEFVNLSLLSSGTIPANPSELLASQRAHELLSRLRSGFDVLVIDTPPAGVVTDALSLAADASATVVVVEADRTNADQAANVIASLRSVGANVVGVVLNKARSRSLGQYSYQYGGYGTPREDAPGLTTLQNVPVSASGLAK